MSVERLKMRTLGEILDAVKAGERPDYDELRYALRAMESLSTFDSNDMRRLVEARIGAEITFEENHRRWHTALNKSPKEWLGHSNDPDNPEAHRRYAAALRLFAWATSRRHDVP